MEQNRKAGKGKSNIAEEINLFETKIKPNKDIEDAVISALLIDDKAYEEVEEILTSDMFAYPENRELFDIAKSLDSKNIDIDILTVSEEAKKRGSIELLGGYHSIAKKMNDVGTAAHIHSHALLIREGFLKRQLAQFGVGTYQKSISNELDVFDLIDETGRDYSKVVDSIKSNSVKSMSNAVITEMIEIEKRMASASQGGVIGVPSGFTDLDRLTGGWRKSDLIILAARPSMGKTAVSLCLARNAAIDANVPTAFFSLEMSTSQLTTRLMSIESEVNSMHIANGSLARHEYQKLTASLDNLTSSPLYIDDTPALNITELKSRARKLKQLHGIGLIVVDYLQLMSGKGKESSREQEISNISRSLKGLAKELNVPVIALSQLSRATETRGGEKKPQLSDLRESGAIEQDADIVIFIYRHEYYGMMVDADGNSTKDTGELIIAKHRNGSLGTVRLAFKPQFTKFTNLEYAKGESLPYVEIKKETGSTFKSEPAKKLIPMSDALIKNVSEEDEDVPF
jgi:replicative DNA helicase